MNLFRDLYEDNLGQQVLLSYLLINGVSAFKIDEIKGVLRITIKLPNSARATPWGMHHKTIKVNVMVSRSKVTGPEFHALHIYLSCIAQRHKLTSL